MGQRPRKVIKNRALHRENARMYVCLAYFYHQDIHLLHPPDSLPSLTPSPAFAGIEGECDKLTSGCGAAVAARALSSASLEELRLNVGVLSRRATSLSTPSKLSN